MQKYLFIDGWLATFATMRAHIMYCHSDEKQYSRIKNMMIVHLNCHTP